MTKDHSNSPTEVQSRLISRIVEQSAASFFDRIRQEAGADAEADILADPKAYPILPRQGYESAYNDLEKIKDNILKSGAVAYANDVTWSCT